MSLDRSRAGESLCGLNVKQLDDAANTDFHLYRVGLAVDACLALNS